MNNNENTEKFSKQDEEDVVNFIKKCGGYEGDDNDVRFIKEIDTFDFKCQQCGECCMYRNDIVLTSYDIFKLSKHLNIKPLEFIIKYTNRSLGAYSRAPMLLLSSMLNGWCPFLKVDYLNGYKHICSVNNVKPGACATHPIGIVTCIPKNIKIEPDNGDNNVKEIESRYIIVNSCPNSKGHGEIHTVKDWLQQSIDEREERIHAQELEIIPVTLFNFAKFSVMSSLFSSCIYNTNYSKMSPDVAKKFVDYEYKNDLMLRVYATICATAVDLIYASYDTNKDFIEQTKMIRPHVVQTFNTFHNQVYKPLKEVFEEITGLDLDNVIKDGDDTAYNEHIRKMLTTDYYIEKSVKERVHNILLSALTIKPNFKR